MTRRGPGAVAALTAVVALWTVAALPAVAAAAPSAGRTVRAVGVGPADVGAVGVGAVGVGPAAVSAPSGVAATVRISAPVSPAAPDARTPTTLAIPVEVTNTGTTTLTDVAVTSRRGAPITTEPALTATFTGTPPAARGDFTQEGPRLDLPGPLAPGASAAATYSVSTGSDGICLCVLGVYTLDLTVTASTAPGATSYPLGSTRTWLPSLTAEQTAPTRIGWLWPLLDRPHRTAPGPAFTDDDLAGSVAAGGRLDRALAAVEQADTASPGAAAGVLLLLDPEILAELVTMTSGYTVPAAAGAVTAGSGGPAAQAWLARLAAVVPRHPARLTAPADPDVVGLAARGVSVPTALSAPDAAAVAAALGLERLPAADLAWPGGTVTEAGLGVLRNAGAADVVLGGGTLGAGTPGGDGTGAAAVDTDTGRVAVLSLDPATVTAAAEAAGLGPDRVGALQRLVALTALAGVLHPTDGGTLLLAPVRDPDVDPTAAALALTATTGLGAAADPTADPAAGLPVAGEDVQLVGSAAASTPSLDAADLDLAAAASRTATALRPALDTDDADRLFDTLPDRIAAACSLSWAAGGAASGARGTADAFRTPLQADTTTWSGGVRIVAAPNNTYSLGSADAPLLLTVANDLPVPVRVRVEVTGAGTGNGLQTGTPPPQTLPGGTRQSVRVPATVDRSGKFDVVATLHSPTGSVIGPAADLTVRSTAVGVVGRVVTWGAGVLLVVALVVRGVRRLRLRRRAGSAG